MVALKVMDDWFSVKRFSDGVRLIQEQGIVLGYGCNIWLVEGRDQNLIIDAGSGLRSLTEEVAAISEKPVTAVLTHAHYDHAGGLHEFERRLAHKAERDILEAPNRQNTMIDEFVRADQFVALPFAGFDVAQYTIQPSPPSGFIDEGDVIDLGDRVFRVMHVPGHSPGSIALFEEASGILFSGDALYDGELYDNYYHSDPDMMMASMERLAKLAVSVVHGGHFDSFSAARMAEIADAFLAGGMRGELPPVS